MGSLEEVACPSGWKWKQEAWKVDTKLACDEEGWQYATVADPNAAFVPVEQMVHTHRRKRLVRVRVLSVPVSTLSVRVALLASPLLRSILRHRTGIHTQV